jgi:hypothetical protein
MQDRPLHHLCQPERDNFVLLSQRKKKSRAAQLFLALGVLT